MLKKLAFSGLFLSLISLPLLAQQSTTPDAPAKNRTERRGRAMQDVDPATRARKMTDRMTKQLNLDQATSKKVYDLTLARVEKMEALRKSTDDRRTKMQTMKAEADAFNSQLKSILTAEQYTKFESMRDQMRHGRGAGRFNGEKVPENGSR